MATLSDFKFVDLTRSVWDREKSQPLKGRYYFSKKVYVKNSDYSDITIRPRHVLSWNRWDKVNDYLEFKEWQAELDAEAVNVGDNLYWPEPLTPKADGTYQWKDSILMQVPFEKHMQARKEAKDRADAMSVQNKQEFKTLAESEGAAIDMPDDEYQKIGI